MFISVPLLILLGLAVPLAFVLRRGVRRRARQAPRADAAAGPLPPVIEMHARALLERRRTSEAITLVCAATGMGPQEAKAFVERL